MKNSNRFISLKRKKLYEEVSEALKQALLAGDYQVGDKLPSEMELVQLFQVSRSVIREAIRYLELSGLVTIKQGATGGPFVSEINSKIVQENMKALLHSGNISVNQLSEVRVHIEPEVARLAALRATEKELPGLDQLAFLSETGEPGIDHIKNNIEFHRLLGKTSHNPFYSIIMNCIMDLTEQFILTIKPVRELIHDRTSHRKIYQAIINRAPDQAAEVIRAHIDEIDRQLKELEKLYLQIAKKQRRQDST